MTLPAWTILMVCISVPCDGKRFVETGKFYTGERHCDQVAAVAEGLGLPASGRLICVTTDQVRRLTR